MAKLVHKEQSYTGGGSSGLLPHIVITSDAENTITVTTPSGSTITPTSTVSGVWECDGDEYGTYTITATYDEYEAEDTVVVDTVKVYPVEIHIVTIPDGSTVLPTDDVSIWLSCAGIRDKSYTTLSEVLDDSETYNALLGDSNASAYMARSTTWTTDICASQYAMNLLGQYDTACDALLSDATWTTALNNSSYWDGHTDSGVLIHGGNPTYDSFYRIVNGSHVPVTDPSLLDVGTYTIYSNGLAKNPSDLSADYGKTVRICPNTKEIVVRPDNALYWWGYKAGRCEELSTANGWSRSGMSFVSPTFDNTKVTITGASNTYCGIATKYSVRSAKAYAIVTTTTSASENRFMGANTSKVLVADTSFPYRTMLTSIETNAKENLTMNASADLYAGVISLGNYPVAVSAFVLE